MAQLPRFPRSSIKYGNGRKFPTMPNKCEKCGSPSLMPLKTCVKCEVPQIGFSLINPRLINDVPLLFGVVHQESFSGRNVKTYNNAIVMATAEKEYLERLRKLQEEIREKYGSLLKNEYNAKERVSLKDVEKEVWGSENAKPLEYGDLFAT